MSLEPGRHVVWIGDLFIDERAPMALCAPHVARVTVPAGWDVNDVRDAAPAFWRDDAFDTVERPACVASDGRVRRRWSSGKMAALPGLFDAAPVDANIDADFESPAAAPPIAAETAPIEIGRAAPIAVPTLEPGEEPARQTLDGLSAMYGPKPDGDAAPDQDPAEDLIESLLNAETPLLARAFRNARAS